MDVVIQNLVKKYGKFRALDDVSLTIQPGVFGLLGPNGAGKTTLMRILATLMPLTSGRVTIDETDIMDDPAFVRQNLGYIPQEFGFYDRLNAYQLLDYIGTMKGLSAKERRNQIGKLLDDVNLTDAAKRSVGGYSGGMKQRLGIAQALLGNPSLIIVDEPTAGLDPEERIRFRNLLARLSGNRTVILSTHIVMDIEVSCSELAVLQEGRLIHQGDLSSLRQQATGKIWQMTIAADELPRLDDEYRVLSSRAVDKGIEVRVLSDENPFGQAESVEPGLEDGYMAVMDAGNSTTVTTKGAMTYA